MGAAKTMRKVILSSILASLALLFDACSRGLIVDVWNNTGQQLTITATYPPGFSKPRLLEIDQRRRFRHADHLKIETKKGTWDFEFQRLPIEYHKTFGFNNLHLTAQIQPDGALYLLLPGSKAPVAEFPPQPPGYPLRPK